MPVFTVAELCKALMDLPNEVQDARVVLEHRLNEDVTVGCHTFELKVDKFRHHLKLKGPAVDSKEGKRGQKRVEPADKT